MEIEKLLFHNSLGVFNALGMYQLVSSHFFFTHHYKLQPQVDNKVMFQCLQCFNIVKKVDT